MAANQVDFKILPSDQFSVYSPQTRSDKVITYFTLLSKLRGDILSVGQDDDPNDIVSAFYSSVGGTQTLHLVKADGSEITASTPEQIISGTVNFVSKFTTANDIGDSQIFDNGTNVGIGTTSMTHKLQLGTGGVFADYYQLDTTYSNGFVIGAISWDIDNGTADIGLSSNLKLKIGQDDTWYVKNQSGSTITKGTVVYASGTLGASGRITIAPMIADGTIPSRFLLGIVAESILDGEDGYVIAKGKIRQINTNAFNDGDVLWVSPTVAGTLTATEPTAPNLKLAIAFVVHKATNGIIAVRATTGTRIADASDVEYAGAADNSFLVYNSATGVWEDEAVSIFKTIAVAGQSSVVADTYTDTLTLAAGTNVSITTDANTDTITINSTDEFVGTVTSVAALTLGTTGTDLSSTVVNSTTTPVITLNVPTASATNRGALSSADWTTFNSKEPALTKGNLTEATSSVLTITGGTNAVIGTGTTIQVAQAGASSSGFLSSADWTTFNSKQSALTFSAPLVNTSGTVSIPVATSLVDGYLSATDFATFNGKQNAITLTTIGTTGAATLIGATLNIPNYADQFVGTVTSVDMSVPTGFAISGNPITASGTLAVAFAAGYSLPTDASQATWNTAYNDSITAFAYNTSTGALTLTQQDAGTLTATVTLQPFSTTNLVEGTNLYYTDTRARLALSAGTGITYDSATGIITNSAPDQTVVLTGGTGISTSGTYPSFTITNTAPDQTVVLTGAGTTTITGTYPNFTISSDDQYDGTVTSVDLTAGTGISVSGGPITTSGSITVTNTAPDQTVVLTASTGITTSGTYPNFTIANSAPDQTVVLTAGTGITTSGAYPSFTVTNSAPDQTVVLTAGTGITTSGTYPSFTVTNDDRGSSQNIFKNIAVAGQSTIVADSNDDTLTVVAGTGISLTTNDSTDTLTITNTAVTNIASFAAYTTQNLSLLISETDYPIEFDVQSITNASFYTHSTTVDPEEITILSAGKYEISMGYLAANFNSAIATVAAGIAINGVIRVPSFSYLQLNTTTNGQYVTTGFNTYIYDLDVNDVITAIFQPFYAIGSTGTITINPAGYDGSTYITIKKIE
jgi:hypothetical protein